MNCATFVRKPGRVAIRVVRAWQKARDCSPEEGQLAAIKLGRIFGIEIRLHFSWVVIFFLVGYSLSFFYFPGRYPELPRAVLIMMGLAATSLFFASILLHEISHSVVARRNGIPIRFITLFVFGGVSSISKEPDNPQIETTMAAAGPATSILLGIVFAAVTIVARAAGAGDAFTGVTGYLAFINVLLGVFNLVPGFPLDGGRLLRAAIWRRTGSIQRATRVATNCGRGFAYLLIGGGLVLILVGGTRLLVNGLWFVFIGLFLDQAARGSYRQVVVSQALSDIPVRDIMTPNPTTIPADISLRQAVDGYFLPHKYGGFPVVDEDEPIGMISLADVRDVPVSRWNEVMVSDIMEPLGPNSVVSASTHVTDVLTRLHELETDRLLVVEHDHDVTGIVTNDDVTQYLRVQVALRPAS